MWSSWLPAWQRVVYFAYQQTNDWLVQTSYIPICEDGLKVSYWMAMNDLMAVSDDRLWNLAYTTMWANTEWEANYYNMYWDLGQWIMSVKFIEGYYDGANDDWEGCDTGVWTLSMQFYEDRAANNYGILA